MSTIDLKSYIESELEEERQLGYSPSGIAVSDADGYPGDPAVEVGADEVSVVKGILGDDVLAYVAKPLDSGGSLPVVIVIHENKGLVPYIQNTACRLAKEGYLALAPDLLSRVGGTGSFDDPAEATKALAALSQEDFVSDIRSVVASLPEIEGADTNRVGILGFCFGGGVAWRVLTKESSLTAGVPFYGPTPPVEDVPGISGSVFAIYGELDERITSMLPGIKEAMDANGKAFESEVFEGAQHAFHNDTNPDRYNADAAAEAWTRVIAYFDWKLK